VFNRQKQKKPHWLKN